MWSVGWVVDLEFRTCKHEERKGRKGRGLGGGGRGGGVGFSGEDGYPFGNSVTNSFAPQIE